MMPLVSAPGPIVAKAEEAELDPKRKFDGERPTTASQRVAVDRHGLLTSRCPPGRRRSTFNDGAAPVTGADMLQTSLGTCASLAPGMTAGHG